MEKVSMIEVTDKAISPEKVIAKVKSNGSGCVVTYIGLIRNTSQEKRVLSVTYQDVTGNAENVLKDIASEAKKKCQLENIAISHRTGELSVGDTNLIVAIASAHRLDGFVACQYVIDQFKEHLPTRKVETYSDGSALVSGIE